MGAFHSSGPNEVLVKSGCCHGQPQLVQGGRVFVLPCVQQIQRLSLNTMTLRICSENVYTQQGVAISVTGIAQVKVQSTNETMLAVACQLFLDKSENEIRMIAQETLEGHQRAIMGNMTIEEIYKDRQKFSESVFEVASSDLINMGIGVVSYTLKDIRDDQGYLAALGMARTAQVKKDARIGEAEAQKESTIKEAIANEKRMADRFNNDIKISESERNCKLNQAIIDIEVNSKKAESELAYTLQAAKTQQLIKSEQKEIEVIERDRQIQVQEQEILRREKELDANIRKPAEAERYRVEKLAGANKNRVILEAEAQAESIRLKGEAQAYAIQVKAKAEAEQMAKKAEAWKDYKDAAIVDMMLEILPEVAENISKPLSNAKKITMISSGEGSIGAAKLSSEVMEIIGKLPDIVNKMTGVDISKAIKSV